MKKIRTGILLFILAAAVSLTLILPATAASGGTVAQTTVNGDTGWYYLVNGKAQTDYTGVCGYSNEYGWWYVENGKVDFSYTGLASNSYGTWYVRNGRVDFSVNSVVEGTASGKSGWWYVVGGKVQTGYTGVCNHCNEYGWWYVRNGMVDFSKNGVEKNDYGWWLVEGGKVNFSYTGVSNYENPYGWWYIRNGKVDFGKTGIEQNRYGWWRVLNGKVDFSCNSVEQNDYGWWYLLDGKVQFGYTGVADYANAYGWWYIKSGKVDFSRTGIESNRYGAWYVSGGKVDFGYSGTVKSGNATWKVTNGSALQTNGVRSYSCMLATAIDGAATDDVNIINKTVNKYMPSYMLKAFQDKGWTLYVTSQSLHKYMDGLYTASDTKTWISVTWSAKKAIWVRDAYANRDGNGENLCVLHEFGHFWDSATGRPSRSDELAAAYAKEKTALQKYDPSWYASDYNATEAYAEVFMCILKDESGIKKACPNLYSYVKDSMSESALTR